MFPGINPFLNTFLKQRHKWSEFHTGHITHLLTLLRQALLPLGYDVSSEDGLQIRGDADATFQARPDVLVTDPADRPRETAAPASTRASEIRNVVDVLALDEDKPYPAVKVYGNGEPLVWMELLSPANKPPNSNFQKYDTKRLHVIQSGVVFIELDYVHWLAPTLQNTPVYARGNQQAAPYRITVIDPHPSPVEGVAYGYPFGILDPVPTVSFPLRENTWYEFDFGAPYRKTIQELLYDQIAGDALESYTDADAERIRAFVADAT